MPSLRRDRLKKPGNNPVRAVVRDANQAAYLHQAQISSALPAPCLVCIGKVSAEAGMPSTTKGSLKLTGIATLWVIGSGCTALEECSDAITNF